MSFYDGFNTSSNIATAYSTASLYYLSTQQVVTAGYSNLATYLASNMSTLSQWTKTVNNTASVTASGVTQPFNGYYPPLVGTVPPSYNYIFNSGSTLNSTCQLVNVQNTITASYGVTFWYAQNNVSSHSNDSFVMSIQNTVDNSICSVYFNGAGIFVLDVNNNLNQLTNVVSTGFQPYWINVAANGNGTYTITLYSFGALLGAATIVLPKGTLANNGTITLSQGNGTITGQQSYLNVFTIGSSCFPDNTTLQGVAYTLPYNASSVNLTFYVEDLSGLTLNTDFVGGLVVGNPASSSATPIALQFQGTYGKGIINYNQPVKVFTGAYTPNSTILSSTQLSYQCKMLNNKLMAVVAAGFFPTSTY